MQACLAGLLQTMLTCVFSLVRSTLDGTASAALLGSDTITLNPGVTCFSDSDCAGNQLKTVCDYTTFTSSYVCDSADGQDMAVSAGKAHRRMGL